MREKYYSIKNLMDLNAVYSLCVSKRSNGKTFSVLEMGLWGYHSKTCDYWGYFENGSKFAVVRRWKDDFLNGRGQEMFKNFINNPKYGNILEKRTKGRWNSVYFLSGRWYLQRVEDDKVVERQEDWFARAFWLNAEEHDKSTSYPEIRLIFFDEFITRKYYLPDEFITFENVCSTIIRDREDVKIVMMANTINRYCPYFLEMGLTNVKSQKQGTIDFYTYGKSDLTVAFEYAKDTDAAASRQASKYFAFDNPKLKMITEGQWEIDLYPHLPCRYLPKEVLYTYMIVFDKEILQCEIIRHPETDEDLKGEKRKKQTLLFTFIHRKTSQIKEDPRQLVFEQGYDPRKNHSRRINHPRNEMEKRIWSFFPMEKVFYQDNSVGETVRNYLNWCVSEK